MKDLCEWCQEAKNCQLVGRKIEIEQDCKIFFQVTSCPFFKANLKEMFYRTNGHETQIIVAF
jgi:hypothetical protein